MKQVLSPEEWKEVEDGGEVGFDGEKFARCLQLPAAPSCTTFGSISRWDILYTLNERAILSLFSSTSIP